MSTPSRPISVPTPAPIPFPETKSSLVGKASDSRKRKRRGRRGYNIQPRGLRWLARVTDPHTGKREAQTFNAKSDAEAWAEDRRAKFRLGQATAHKTPFETVASEYLIDLGRRSRSALHYKTVEQTVEALKKAGMVDLAAANAVSVVSKLLAGLKTRQGGKASPKTRNNFLVRLNAIANWAVLRDYLIKNRFLQIKPEKIVKRDKPVFTLDECGRLVDPKHKDHPFFKPLACMLYTGFRGSEMRHMQWDWFLWDANRIMLTLGDRATEALDEDEEDDEDAYISKTGRERLTCLTAELRAIMKSDKDQQGPVFPELVDMDRGVFRRLFNAYLTHCGVPLIKRRSPHSCRHTWTCVRLAAGENEMLVKQQAGHTDKEMTEHYAKQQDRYRDQIERAGWPRGELRFRDFTPC
jgi:integrase